MERTGSSEILVQKMQKVGFSEMFVTIHRTARWLSPQHSRRSASHELYLDTGNASVSSVRAASRYLAQVAMFLSLNSFLYVFLHLLMQGLSDVTKFMTRLLVKIKVLIKNVP
jgi:hypothetical protein